CCTLPFHHSFPTRRSSDLVAIQNDVLREDVGDRLDLTLGHGRDERRQKARVGFAVCLESGPACGDVLFRAVQQLPARSFTEVERSEEHTSELQSRENLVCR